MTLTVGEMLNFLVSSEMDSFFRQSEKGTLLKNTKAFK